MAVFCGVSKVVFFPVISTAALYKRFDINGNPIAIKRILSPPMRGRFTGAPFAHARYHRPVFYRIGMADDASQAGAGRPNARRQGHVLYPRKPGLRRRPGNCRLVHSAILRRARVILERDAMMGRHYPAVVIAHGLGFSNEQYLNLAHKCIGPAARC